MGVLELIKQFEDNFYPISDQKKSLLKKKIKRNGDSLLIRYGKLESLWR